MNTSFASVFNSFCNLAVSAESEFDDRTDNSFSEHFKSYVEDFRKIEGYFEQFFRELTTKDTLPANLRSGMRDGIVKLCSFPTLREAIIENPDLLLPIINSIDLNDETMDVAVDNLNLSSADGSLLTSAIGFVLNVEQGLSKYPVSEQMLENPDETINQLVSAIQTLSRDIAVKYPRELTADERKVVMSLFLQSVSVVIQREIRTCAKALLEQRLDISINDYRSWSQFIDHLRERFTLEETHFKDIASMQSSIKTFSIELASQISVDSEAWTKSIEIVIFYQLLNIIEHILSDLVDDANLLNTITDLPLHLMNSLKEEVSEMSPSIKWAKWEIDWIKQRLANIAGTIQALVTFPEQVDVEETEAELKLEKEIETKEQLPEDEYEEYLKELSSSIDDFEWHNEETSD